MSAYFEVELTDLFAGNANYAWRRVERIIMPDITHYGYTGCTDGSYNRANRAWNRELMRRAKAAMDLTGIRGVKEEYGYVVEFRPYKRNIVMFVYPVEDE